MKKIKSITYLLFLLSIVNENLAQKPIIDTNVTGKWHLEAPVVRKHTKPYLSAILDSATLDQAMKKIEAALPGNWGIMPGYFELSGNRKWVFGALVNNKPNYKADSLLGVNIWSYRDRLLNPQLKRYKEIEHIVVGTEKEGGVTVIARANECLLTRSNNHNINKRPVSQSMADFAVVCDREDIYNYWWPPTAPAPSYFIVSLKDGSRRVLKKESKSPLTNFSFSPTGRWLMYWDSEVEGWMSYDVVSGERHNITRSLLPVCREKDVIIDFLNAIYAHPVSDIAGWYANDEFLVIYDRYDIWRVDPSGLRAPLNLTRGYGAKNHVKLRLVEEDEIYTGKETVLLTGFNTDTKYNGFFKIKLNENNSPELLTMGPYVYYLKESQLPHFYSLGNGMQPVEIERDSTKCWLVQRMSYNEYPNYYTTTDFKQFKAVTNYQPQKAYNWLTAELISWRQLDGTMTQGVLYKPENFDPHKKYPLIFNYYEHLSFRLYSFPMPGLTTDNINIPWFVSRGYLVLTPDIHYSVASSKGGKLPGEAACNSILGAAKYLATLPYVDTTKLAIQGHSFGGGETNFLLTHSNIFAAACSASATVSNEISAYLGMIRGSYGPPREYRINHVDGHDMIGATLWERPDLYIKASPVFRADKVTTPLLMMQCQNDDGWEQGSELYMALRRLGKKVWMLDYDGEDHVLRRKEAALDYTIRLTQFFDHYLKDAPAPKWMTQSQYDYDSMREGLEMDDTSAKP